MVFLPQASIELLLAEHFFETESSDHKDLLQGQLSGDGAKLRKMLNRVSGELRLKHRRSLSTTAAIYITSLKLQQTFDAIISFPKVSFTEISSSPADPRGSRHLEKKINATDLTQILEEHALEDLL